MGRRAVEKMADEAWPVDHAEKAAMLARQAGHRLDATRGRDDALPVVLALAGVHAQLAIVDELRKAREPELQQARDLAPGEGVLEIQQSRRTYPAGTANLCMADYIAGPGAITEHCIHLAGHDGPHSWEAQ